MRIAVLGAGAWGTALALRLSLRHTVTLWTRSSEHAQQIRSTAANERYLRGFPVPDTITVTADLAAAVAAAELVLVVVPSSGFRATLEALAALSPAALIWACKGLEPGTTLLPHQVVEEVFGDRIPCGVLSGPTFAEEVARGLPTAITLASRDAAFAREAAHTLHDKTLRIYNSDDVIGVEIGGAVKNVMAIAAGISDGMGFGNNARAALITRGLAEMARLSQALGGGFDTIMGLAGAGDLILTCTGDMSRNRRVGLALAAGKPLAEIIASLGHTAEGVHTALELTRLIEQHQVDMPVTSAVCAVLHDNLDPKRAVEMLLAREPKPEYLARSSLAL